MLLSSLAAGCALGAAVLFYLAFAKLRAERKQLEVRCCDLQERLKATKAELAGAFGEIEYLRGKIPQFRPRDARGHFTKESI